MKNIREHNMSSPINQKYIFNIYSVPNRTLGLVEGPKDGSVSLWS